MEQKKMRTEKEIRDKLSLFIRKLNSFETCLGKEVVQILNWVLS